ncbi:MAG: dihydropyrimidinase [Pseudomonadota bacterium]
MGLLVKNGEIITASERYFADIWCGGEEISRIEKNIQPPPNATVVDAKGKYVFPGFVDPHAHIYLPFMGTYGKDNYTTASKAALLGGTTCFFDFVIASKTEQPLAALETWNKNSGGKSACDYAYHIAVTRFDKESESQLREIVGQGNPSFKIFLGYKGALGVEDDELFNTLSLAKELGVITTAHCENAIAITALQQRFLSEGKTEPKWHYYTRPPLVEAEGTHHFTTFAQLTNADVYIVHLSCAESLSVAQRAQNRGVKVWIETLIEYLLLDKTYAEQANFEGAKYVMSPPLREKHNQDILWCGLNQGLISTVGTDHAPFDFADQKRMGINDFTKIPNGIPALQDRVNMLYSYGVLTGKLDIHRFVAVASTEPAKVFGLFPRKGTIQPGADADLVIYDPKYEGKLSAKTHAMNVDYNAFEGWSINGRPDTVTVRGEVAVSGGKFVGKIGRGTLLSREPTHF